MAVTTYFKDITISNGESETTYLIEPILYINTGGTNAAYTATLDNFALVQGATVQAKFSTTNAADATLSINNGSAISIQYNNESILAGYLRANHLYTLLYDGTYWQVVGDIDTNTTYTIATGTANGKIKVTPSRGNAYEVSVYGLGSAAYTDSTAYASSTHNHNDNYIAKLTTSTDHAIVRFDGEEGQVQNSKCTIDDNGAIHVGGEGIYFKGANDLTAAFKITKSNVDKDNIDMGWEWTSIGGAGAFFHSNANTSSPGMFGFFARKKSGNSAITTELYGYPGSSNNNGKLTWGGRRVVTATDNTQIGDTNIPVYVNSSGIVTAGTALGTASTHNHGDYATYNHDHDTTYLKLDGTNNMTGTLNLTPASGEGGEIHLNASTAQTTQAGIVLDQQSSKFRIFGIASVDGTTKTGTGTPLIIDPYAKTITGGYTITGSLNGNASSATLLKATTDKINETETTYTASSWNVVPANSVKVWGESFKNTGLQYDDNGTLKSITDTGDIVMWLAPAASGNAATLCMRIDGTIQSNGFIGNASTATKLATARELYVNLSNIRDTNNKITFNGSAAKALSITGTLSIDHGGTGATSAQAAIKNLFTDSTVTVDSDDFTDNTVMITSDKSGSTDNWYQRAGIKMWNYIKSKADSVYADINALSVANALVYKGTIAGAVISDNNEYGALTDFTANCGDTYKVSAPGFINGLRVEIGDMLICTTDDTPAAEASGDNIYSTVRNNWNIIQTSEGSVSTSITSTITDKTLAIFDGTSGRIIKDASTITYIPPTDAELGATKGKVTGLFITGTAYGNTAANLASNKVNVFRYGDPGPQIRFGTSTSASELGAIIWSNNSTSNNLDSAFYFVGCKSNNTEANVGVVTKTLVARTRLAVGLDYNNTDYVAYLNGATYINGTLTVNNTIQSPSDTTLTINSNNTIIFKKNDSEMGRFNVNGVFLLGEYVGTGTYDNNTPSTSDMRLFVNGNIYTTGILQTTNNTASTSTTTGSIITDGGIATNASSYLTGTVVIDNTTAHSNTPGSAQLVVRNSSNEAGNYVALELQRGTYKNTTYTSWQIAVEDSGNLHIKNNYNDNFNGLAQVYTADICYFTRNTGLMTLKGGLTTNGNITAPAGNIVAGTNGSTSAERQVGVQSGAGRIYMYSVASTTGNRGIYIPAHGTGSGKSVFVVDQNNGVTFYGALSGNADSATTATTATNLTNKPVLAAGTSDTNKITVKAGEKTSDEFTVPYATKTTTSERLEDLLIVIQTGENKQTHITLSTLLTWLITTKKYIPSKVRCHRRLIASWAYANNDYLQINCDNIDYEIQLAGCLIEWDGYAGNNFLTNNDSQYRIRIHTSPANAFNKVTNGYTKAPLSSVFEYFFNGSTYTPTWRCLTHFNWDKIVTGKPTTLSGYGITDAATDTHVHGNILNDGTITDKQSIANNYRLVITDDSNNVTSTSIVFDGSTTTKALTPKGTWETFSKLTIGTSSTTAMAGDTNVNNVTQSATTAENWHKVILSGGDVYAAYNTAVSERTNKVFQAVGIAAQPSTGTLRATILQGGSTILTGSNIQFTGTKATTSMITFLDNTANSNGNGIKIGGGGVVVIGSGESASNFSPPSSDVEKLYLLSDNQIYLETNGQSIANRVGFYISNSNALVPIKAETETDNYGSIGTSSYKWANMYATTFNGNLIGDVTGDVTGDLTGTATNATNDSDGNAINTTYVKKVSSTDDAIVRFNGTDGTVQNSKDIITDNGTLCINTNISSGSYNEGLRINAASNGWAIAVLGGAADSIKGTDSKVWLIGRRGTNCGSGKFGSIGDLTIEDNSSTGSGLTLHNGSGGMSLYTNKTGTSTLFQIKNAASVAAGSWIKSIITLAPSMAANSNIIFKLGNAESDYNSGYYGYHYEAADSNTSYLTMGIHGKDHLVKIFGTGQVSITTNITSESTSTGSLIVAGGAGFVGTVYAGGFNGPLTGEVTGNVNGTITQTSQTSSYARPIWFSHHDGTNVVLGQPGYSNDFTYNPSTHNINFTANASITVNDGKTLDIKTTTAGLTLSSTTGILTMSTTSGNMSLSSGGTVSISSGSSKTLSISSGSTLNISSTTNTSLAATTSMSISGIQGISINSGSSYTISFKINNVNRGEFNRYGMFQLNDVSTQNTHNLYVNGDSAFNGKIVFGYQLSNVITAHVSLQWDITNESLDFVFE